MQTNDQDIIVRYLDCCAQTALIPSEKAITLSLLRKCTPLTSDLIRMQVIIPLAIRFLDAVLSPLLPAHPNLPPNSSNVNTLHSYARFFKPAQTNTIIGIESIGLLTDVVAFTRRSRSWILFFLILFLHALFSLCYNECSLRVDS